MISGKGNKKLENHSYLENMEILMIRFVTIDKALEILQQTSSKDSKNLEVKLEDLEPAL